MILECTDLYVEQLSKSEQVDLKYLSECKDQIKDLVAERISSSQERKNFITKIENS